MLSILDSNDIILPDTSKVYFPGLTYRAEITSGEMLFKTSSTKGLAVSQTGGTLHGTWIAESIVSASDRRLKHTVQPLAQAIMGQQQRQQLPHHQQKERNGGTSDGGGVSQQFPASKALSSLRPRFFGRDLYPAKDVGESQNATQDGNNSETEPRDAASPRLDASDVERVLPDLVRALPNGQKRIAHDDLIAVLTMAAKERQTQLEAHELLEVEEDTQIREQASLLTSLESAASALRMRFARLRERMS
jgi:hypothetical protein